MKIDKKLNLVCSISRDDGSLIYVHTSPFPYEVVEEHCLMLGSLFTSFIAQVGGLGAARVAAMMLRKKIKKEQEITDQDGPNIVDEIQRQTTVIFNDNGQWKSVPLDSAMKQGIISADEFREVEGEIVFFYGFLCHSETGTHQANGGERARYVRWSVNVIDRYGVARFFTDVENGYRYPEPDCPAGNVVYTLLDWASNEGFRDVVREIAGEEYASPSQFRQRFILSALKERGHFNGS